MNATHILSPFTARSIADECWTTAQAAHWLQRNEGTLKRWRWQRKGPPYFTIHGRVYYAKEALAEWLETQQRTNGSRA